MISHEFGHNLGMRHAASLLCGSKAIDNYASCTFTEYGDPFDVMGNSWIFRHINSAHKAQLGWVSPQSVSSSGIFSVKSLSVTAGPQSLKIAKPDTG